MQNVVEVDTPRVTELRLGHNLLEELDGFLLGLPGLRTLDLSHNRLRHLPPDELLGLDQLRFIDLSYNHLTSFADTAKVRNATL
jgi:Leucine-rich repeat (LRR) protein